MCRRHVTAKNVPLTAISFASLLSAPRLSARPHILWARSNRTMADLSESKPNMKNVPRPRRISFMKNEKKKPRHGWAPDPPMVGIRSPIGVVVGSYTSHPGVLGSIPKQEEPGKTGAPCAAEVPGSSRVPANSFVLGTAVINTHTPH